MTSSERETLLDMNEIASNNMKTMKFLNDTKEFTLKNQNSICCNNNKSDNNNNNGSSNDKIHHEYFLQNSGTSFSGLVRRRSTIIVLFVLLILIMFVILLWLCNNLFGRSPRMFILFGEDETSPNAQRVEYDLKYIDYV